MIVWITGAGKGIGRALARELAAKGWVVAVSARTAADIATLAEECAGLAGRIVAFPLDVTDAAAIIVTLQRIEAELGPLDLAVLNAGSHEPVKAKTFEVALFRRLVDVNLMGTVNCLAALLPIFLARKGGEIAVVASVAGYRGLPTAAAYGATKAALINMCEALMPELERDGVRLRLICPGFVDTPLTRKNTFPMPFMVSPETAARAIVAGLAKSRFDIVFPWPMALAMKTLRILPYRLFFRVTRRMVS
jgi:short-subunit dehydrogenase